ncbi:MAG: 4-hydroxy-tetrahydrodipicolinate reductase [Chitinophagales bacterium]|nr:4-hydroxy-tetrahydrodipicolinate reductase [Chitinophagales bacterium]HMV03852.1 4-hydroxy-tetrahydrodipicolinate reductase [Chitinophagales bacterium]HMW95401.1 4-hydroxy-tetrahydrodipicolinate reductase [Chitinophagales bacterium]HMZ95321.1 4-hydroxy-tetrahydrodipicolinate reductase [Chitinophagales bacterium]HNC65172.1 4-hydroxy-tetrahydrodipicolinate reductase [Chitinophagales bacterium]
MNIALIGYGKMGKAIHEIANQKNEQLGENKYNIQLIVDIDNRATITLEDLQKCDVAIEFTSPHTAIDNIKWCFEAGIPVVVGSTGWLDKLDEIKALASSKNQTILYSPNFSIGVNIFFEMNRQLAKIMNKYDAYDVEMEEIHHTEKKDAPSGTALYAALDVLKFVDRKADWKNEQTKSENTLDIISLREPNVPGTHTVTYNSEIDSIELKHTAHNRKGFAGGAVVAAEWLVGKKGVYTMDDVLGFNQ